MSGMKRANSAAPTGSYFAFSVSLHWISINSICMCEVLSSRCGLNMKHFHASDYCQDMTSITEKKTLRFSVIYWGQV